MYQALYRKWRPRTFDDVVGQQNITVTLANEVESGSISHAYLFTGSRGTGKTTCAKILAKAVNCINPQKGNPCNVCEICMGIDSGAIMDVMELDAASNNGVDDIREMIDETNFTPVKAKYRVYVIDEVHMLTAAASNAFLKTLEEPPAHVIFILATTDPNKLLPTVRSRCQRFDFRRINPEDIAGRLQYIALQEGFLLDGDAAALIARIADGGLRDAVSLLDLCSTTDKIITVKTVGAVAGIADKEFLFVLTDCIKSGDTGKALELINELHNSFSDMGILCSELINHLRSLMIIKSVRSADALIVCTKTDFDRLVKQAGLFTLDEILHSMFLLEETAFNLSKGYNKRTELELAVIRLCTGLYPAPAAVKTEPAELKKSPEPKYAIPSAAVPAPPPVFAKVQGAAVDSDPVAKKTTEPETNFVKIEAAEKPVTETALEAEEWFETEDNIDINDGEDGGADMKPESCVPAAGQSSFTFWPDILRSLYEKDPALWGFLRQSAAFTEEDILFVCLENLAPAENLLKIGDHLSILTGSVCASSGKNYKVNLIKEGFQPKKSDEEQVSSLLDTLKKLKSDS